MKTKEKGKINIGTEIVWEKDYELNAMLRLMALLFKKTYHLSLLSSVHVFCYRIRTPWISIDLKDPTLSLGHL